MTPSLWTTFCAPQALARWDGVYTRIRQIIAGNKVAAFLFAVNGAVMEMIYKQKSVDFDLIRKSKEGHHPDGLVDPTPVVDFIAAHSGLPVREKY